MKKNYWIALFFVCLLVSLTVFLSYFIWFWGHLGYKISDKTEVWGQFGDFIGGVLNPILSFATILILIITTVYQQSQNKISEKREFTKRLDDKVYGLLSYQREQYDKDKISLVSGGGFYVKDIIREFENIIYGSSDISVLNNERIKEKVFTTVRNFYLVIKTIDDAAESIPLDEDEKKYYYSLSFNMTDFSLVKLVVFCVFFYKDIKVFEYLKENSLLVSEMKKVGLGSYIDSLLARKDELGID